MSPLLIQNAAADPRYREHPAVRLGLTRYLGVPVSSSAGEVLGTLCFLDDRSDQVLNRDDVEFLSLLAMRASVELEREQLLNERVSQEREAAEQLRALNRRLLRAAEEKRRFVTTVIHDLRQPLASMRTLIHLLSIETDPEEQQESLALLDQGTRVMSGIVDELLTYVQIETGQMPWRSERIELQAFLSELLAPFYPIAEAHGVRLLLEVPARHPIVRLDRAQLSHLVMNLVSNAIKFTAGRTGSPKSEKAEPRVTVRAQPEPRGRWRLEVEDSGIGIGAIGRERIFEEFYQAPETRACELQVNLPPGRGLGLAIVRHIAGRMGASIILRSQPGEGTCFILSLPRVLRDA